MENEYYGIYLDDGLPSPSVESTRRELFEAWFQSLNYYTPTRTIYSTCWCYDDPQAQDAWSIWNAALDAVVIELPEETYGNGDRFDDGYGIALDDCRDNIISLNLGLKIK